MIREDKLSPFSSLRVATQKLKNATLNEEL